MTALSTSLTERLLQPGSPFELSPAMSSGRSPQRFRHAPDSLNGLYQKAVGSAARVYMHFSGRDITYGEILSEANALGRRLRTVHGISSGDRVAIILPGCPQWVIAFIAVTSIGAVAVLIQQQDPVARILSALSLTGCQMVITDEATGRMLSSHADGRPQILAGAGTFAGVTLTESHLHFDVHAIDPEREALIAFTTGSTSPPKAVISSHRAVISGIMNMMLAGALASARNRSRIVGTRRAHALPSSLLLAPLTHVGGYSHLLLMMQVAGKVALLPSWQATAAIDLIEKQELHTISGANAGQLRELLRADAAQGRLGSLTSIGLHGEALRANVLNEIRDRLPAATPGTGYGLTETNGSFCAAVGADLIEHPHSCGPIVPSVELRLLDEQGEPVPTGRTGEIWVRGAMLMSGYCSAGTPRSVTSSDSWFCTDDYGRIDEHGFLYLAERRQDVFYCEGKPLSVAALERLAYECEHIDEAAVFFTGVGRSVRRVVIAVVPRKGAQDHEPKIVASVAREVPAGACEVDVLTLPRLPRLPSGKIDRRALRQHVEESHEWVPT